jgi:hypothetical protein
MSRFISTASGRRFYFAKPMPDMVNIFDVATGLGNLCRFTGQCSRFYSVAEHSVHVSRLVPPEHARAALLHDATEAYVNDLAKPFKVDLPDYCAAEKRVWGAVAGAFGLPLVLPQCIKDADLAILKTEVAALLPLHCLEELDLPGNAAPIALSFWSPRWAQFHFMQRYKELTP